MENMSWEMNIFTFSYWFIIDKDGLNKLITAEINGAKIKFYVPYRSSPANTSFLPQPNEALFLDGKLKPINEHYLIPKTAIYPLFDNGGTGIIGFQGEDKETWNANGRNRKDIPADTIRLDVKSIGNFNLLEYLRMFVEIIRVKSRQWWIGHLPYLNDHIQIKQLVNDNGESTDAPPSAFSPYIFVSDFSEKVIDFEIWSESINDLIEGKRPPIYYSSFLDAMYYCSRGDTRRTVLDLANTLDTAVDINFKRVWLRDRMGTAGNYSRRTFIRDVPAKDSNRFNSSTNIPLLISHITQNKLGKSFALECASDFGIISVFWEEKRNPVSHGTNLVLESNELTAYIHSIQTCINWLESL